ncbi:hypothetical protein P9209_01890 [Prescottella defluvii]|nr:hypothetical protein P9209_01890 [Prescottella defluvii]
MSAFLRWILIKAMLPWGCAAAILVPPDPPVYLDRHAESLAAEALYDDAAAPTSGSHGR